MWLGTTGDCYFRQGRLVKRVTLQCRLAGSKRGSQQAWQLERSFSGRRKSGQSRGPRQESA
jgi:hypothetical protein